MINKPQDFNEVLSFTETEKLTRGGHICVIKTVEEAKSMSGRDMIKIYLDTDASDSQPNFYGKKYNPENRWGCIVHQVISDNDGKTSRGFKTFITSVLESNDGFEVQWGKNFCDCLAGKLVGGVFRGEEFMGRDNSLATTIRCFTFRSVDAIRDGVQVPPDKKLGGTFEIEIHDVPFGN